MILWRLYRCHVDGGILFTNINNDLISFESGETNIGEIIDEIRGTRDWLGILQRNLSSTLVIETFSMDEIMTMNLYKTMMNRAATIIRVA